MNKFKIELKDDKAYIYTPYSDEFVSKIKSQIGGAKWDYYKECWVVNDTAVPFVRQIMRDVYGEDDISVSKKINIQVEILNDLSAERKDVVLFGKCLCHAYGRDYCGKFSEDVVYVEGKPTSGGSNKYWCSIVPKGCLVNIYNVNESIYEKFKDSDDYNVVVIDDNADRTNLRKKISEIEYKIANLEEMKENYKKQLEVLFGEEYE